MTQAAEAPTTTTTNEAPSELGGTVEERADAIFGPATFDDGDEGEETAETGAPPAAAPAPAPAPVALDQAAQDRAKRRADALAALNEKTRAAVDSKAAQREAESLRQRNQQLEQQARAYSTYVDPRQLTKEQFFELAQQNPNIDPKDLGAWLREQQANPELQTQRVAKAIVDPQVAQLQQALDAANAKIDGFITTQTTQQREAAEVAAHQQIASFTNENAATSPYSASFLRSQGADKYRATVDHVIASGKVVGAGEQAILDAVEDFLIEEHNALNKQMSAWNPTASAAPQRTQANQPRISGPATQAPTHVTNSLAQTRSSVVNEEAALEDMPYEERASFIFRRH